MRILILLLMVFIISCGNDNKGEEKGLLCNPSSSTVTTDDISGVWYAEKGVMGNNSCTDDNLDKALNIYFKLKKLDICKVRFFTCKDGANCNDLDDKTYDYILEGNKFILQDILKNEETQYENCYIKQTLTETTSFISNTEGSITLRSDVLIDDTCPEYLQETRCYTEGNIYIKKIGEYK